MKTQYIAIEGADGTGKTTLAKHLAELVEGHFTYEPNGETEIGKALRTYCLDKKYYNDVNWRVREYLLLASRALSTKKIETKLHCQQTVVSDRSFVSGLTYAHVASKMDFMDWWKLAETAFWVKPQLVVYVYTDEQKIDVTEGDIYDDESDSFHKQIKATFPEALRFLKDINGFNIIHFKNDFNASPMENAKRLKEYIESAEDEPMWNEQ